jgi:hypothetical protein
MHLALSCLRMPISQDESALSRGRIPPYLRRYMNDLLRLLLDNRSHRARIN